MKKQDILVFAVGSMIALAATIYIIKRIRNSDDDEKPPKNAPQLDIENPGSQDDFPAAPSVSQIG